MKVQASAPSPLPAPPKRRPPAYLFALGRKEMPAEFEINGTGYRFVKLFKHDFFAATGLYQRLGGNEGDLAVLKIQRTYRFFWMPMRWAGRIIANHEIRIYEALQGVPGVPAFLGRLGPTGFVHAFIPGEDLHAELPLTPKFFEQLRTLFEDLHARKIAYVDSNKRENILYGSDQRPWLIDFQISFHLTRWLRWSFFARWLFRRFVRADMYHLYKHKTRLLPEACSAEDFERARKRGSLHRIHRLMSRPIIVIRRKFLSRYDLANTR
jgi:hypothetical protein